MAHIACCVPRLARRSRRQPNPDLSPGKPKPQVCCRGRSIVALSLVLIAASAATANVGFQPVSPDELRMTSEPLAPGAPAVILYRLVDRDDNGYTSHEDWYYRIKILTEEGRSRADIEIPFVKQTQEVVGIKARTIKPDGSIVTFDGKIFEKQLVKTRYQGRGVKYLAKTFTLPDVEVGSILEYFYTVDFVEHFLFDSHWLLSEDLFTKSARFSLRPYKGNDSQTFVLRWNWQRLPAGTDPPHTGSDGVIRMESSNIPAFQEEDFMPPPEELKSRVDFFWEEALKDKDAASYWKRIGKQREGQMESFVRARATIDQAVGQIVSPNDTPEAKLRKIYARVQHLRNTSFEVEKTEQEQKRAKEKIVESVNADDIWKRGYGNGTELTWLFLALVRAAGIDATGCWVASRDQYFFSPNTMQSNKLNSNVVLVNLNGKDLYLNPGVPFTTFGLLPWPETGAPGLRLGKDGGTWIQTPSPDASESRIHRLAKLKLTTTGDLEGKLTLTYTGLEAQYRRTEERHADDVERKKYLEDAVTSEIVYGAEVNLTNHPDWNNPEAPLVAEFDLKIPGWASNAGTRIAVPAAVFTVAEKRVFQHTSRVNPIYFEFPHEKYDEITIALPSGWQVSSLPPMKDEDGHVIRYVLKLANNQQTLQLTRQLTINLGMLDVKYYPALRAFFQAVRTGDDEQIVLQSGGMHAGN